VEKGANEDESCCGDGIAKAPLQLWANHVPFARRKAEMNIVVREREIIPILKISTRSYYYS
jgi:hypothetical protein